MGIDFQRFKFRWEMDAIMARNCNLVHNNTFFGRYPAVVWRSLLPQLRVFRPICVFVRSKCLMHIRE